MSIFFPDQSEKGTPYWSEPRVTLVVKFLQRIVLVSYEPSMFIWITVRLVSPLWNKWRSRRLGSQTQNDLQTVWSALVISLAINTLMILGESGPYLSLFIVNSDNKVKCYESATQLTHSIFGDFVSY